MTWYVVDGLDGSGKSTAAEELVRLLEADGRKVLVRTHPGDGSVFGRLSARFLLIDGKAATLAMSVFYFLDVLCSVRAMRRGGHDDTVFVRYLLETAYFPDRLYRVCGRVASAVMAEPDVSVLLDIDPGKAMERITLRGEALEVYENAVDLERTRRHMLDLAGGWHVIDNNGTEAELREKVGRLYRETGEGRSR